MEDNKDKDNKEIKKKIIKIHGKDELLTIDEASKLLNAGTISTPMSSSFEFNNLKNQIYFLSNVKDQKNIQNIHYVDMNDESNKEIKPLFNYVDNNVELSLEDQLQRERQRVASNGITQFTFNEKHQFIIAPINNKLNKIDVSNCGNKDDESLTVFKEINGEIYNYQLSPDGKIVSYLKDKDIWITDISSNKMYQITFSNGKNDENKFKYAGDVGFIYAEEFSRYTGYWWSPNIEICEKTGKPLYSILYLEEDETNVMDFHIPTPDLKGKTTQYKYPLAGEKNSTSKVFMVQFVLSSDDSTISIKNNELFDLKIQFPWLEYITRAGWLPNSKDGIWLQLLDRKQEHLALVIVPLSSFNHNASATTTTTPPPPLLPILIEETTNYWINIEFSFHFLKSKNNQLIWSNEQTGYRHLYLIEWCMDQGKEYSNIKSTPITLSKNESNDWMVSNFEIFVDEVKSLVYFSGTKDSCLEQHLYVAKFGNGTGEIKRLTHSNYSHKSILVSNDFKKFISTYSNINTPPKTEVFDIEFDNNNNGLPTNVKSSFFIKSSSSNNKNENDTTTTTRKPPTIFNFKNSKGITIYGQYSVPIDYNSNEKYPSVLYVYGGPHVQLVRNQYNYIRQHYPNFGFIEIMIDSLGSTNRGLEFEGQLKFKMGQIEIQDQIEGIEYLIKNQLVSIDPKRIAISGWSYGGYLSLMGIAQRPDFFKISCVGAPVSSWVHYNTGYTERYMGTPQDQPNAYKLGDVINYINNFPDQDNRLILIHGAQDENVHFSNTSYLIDNLTSNQKPYILKYLPNERHGVRNENSKIYIDYFIINHLLKYL